MLIGKYVFVILPQSFCHKKT